MTSSDDNLGENLLGILFHVSAICLLGADICWVKCLQFCNFNLWWIMLTDWECENFMILLRVNMVWTMFVLIAPSFVDSMWI